jgi:hypothetical protein
LGDGYAAVCGTTRAFCSSRLVFGLGVGFGTYVVQVPGRGLSVTHVEAGFGLGAAAGDLLVTRGPATHPHCRHI